MLSAGALMAIIAYLAVFSYQQTSIWKDDEALFTDLINKYPASAIGQNNLGIVLLEKSDLEGAKSRFERAIELTPSYVMPYPNLAYIYETQGQHQKAIDLYLKAVAIQPDLRQVYQLIGSIYLNGLHDPVSAEKYFRMK
jgi:tetratricopeptide (TPR) repeat protein